MKELKKEKGATLAEFAMTTVVLIGILLGIIRLTERVILTRVEEGKRTYSPYNMSDPAPR